jgi:hypothetical protein
MGKTMGILFLAMLAVNGTLFAGTIIHSALKTARYEESLLFIEQLWKI